MAFKFNPLTGNLDLTGGGTTLTDPLLFKGAIDSSDDFPTSAEVQNGWFYRITTDVADDDGSKTNTGQSFESQDEIVWNGTGWTILGNVSNVIQGISSAVDENIVVFDGTSGKLIKDSGVKLSDIGGGADTEQPKITIGDGVNQIQNNTNGIFWVAPWNGNITEWRIWTADGNTRSIETDVLKNGTTIGEDIDLSSAANNYATGLSINFTAGDSFKFNIDNNTNARKIVVQLLAEKV